MQDLKVTLVQIHQVWEDKKANFEIYENELKQVETDIIVFPEMFQTGFTMNVKEMGEDWENSKSIRWLKSIALEKNAAIYTSLIIKEDEKYFNRGVFVFPNGEIEFYDKRKSFALAGEDQFFTSGTEPTIVEYLGWKIQLQICFDLRFPEISRNYIEENGIPSYDLLLYVANWPKKRILHWDTLLKARAIENQCYVAGVNRVGIDQNNLGYNGHSTIVSPLGDDVIGKKEGKSTSSLAIKFNFLSETRKKLPFLLKR